MTTLAINGWRARLGHWVESPAVRHFITGLIILNAVVLGLETSRQAMDVAGGTIQY